MPTIACHCILGVVNKRTVLLGVLALAGVVGCQGATETPPPQPPTVQVIVIPVVATPVPSDTPLPTASPTATATPTVTTTSTQPPPTPTRPTATVTRPRPTATPAPTATPPDILSEGNYASAGTVRVQFVVSNGGTLANGGFFNYHCPADGALSTYGFADPAAIVGGKFAFSAVPSSSGAPQVTLVCNTVTLTQARCTIRNTLATTKCLDTPVTVSRK